MMFSISCPSSEKFIDAARDAISAMCGQYENYPVVEMVTEEFISKLTREIVATLGLNEQRVRTTIDTVVRIWTVLRRAGIGSRHIDGAILICRYRDDGRLYGLSFVNHHYPCRLPNMDAPIGPLGSGGDYGGLRAIPEGLQDEPIDEVDLTNNFELDTSTLVRLPRSLRKLVLENLELNSARTLPGELTKICPSLNEVNLSDNPNGWLQSLTVLPPSVKRLLLIRRIN